MTKKLNIDGVFKKALPVLEQIVDAGFEAYFVGGSVRDQLLNLEVDDVDIATSAQPQEIKQIFKRTVDVGIDHGTVMVLIGDDSYEITTFRTESTYKDFRHPDSVTFVRSLTEDLKRRDFTMNAIAMDLEGNIIDPFNGINDMNKKVIQAVGNPHERFKEDALRMMRGVRFAAQLDFEIEGETLISMKDNAPLLKNIAVERIQVEFEKLLTGQWHTIGLAAMIKTDLYLYCPALANKRDALMDLIADELPFENTRQAWAFFLYTIDKQAPSGTFQPRQFLKAWKLSNQMISESTTIYRALKTRVENGALDAWDIFQLGKVFASEVEYLVEHLELTPQYIETLDTYEALPIKDKDELALTGHDLMQETPVKPGQWMGEAIRTALEAVVYAKIPNDKSAIIAWLNENQKIPALNEEEV
jgi:tRNA nucleotidyltransferase (CCA-adding enzyme)